MARSFRKSITLAKGVKVNLGKTGASISYGTKGLKQTVHTSGRVRTTLNLPGMHLSGSKNLVKELEKQKKSLDRQNAVKAYEERIDRLTSFHKTREHPIDWGTVYREPAPKIGIFGRYRSWEERHILAEKVISGDVDSYLAVIGELEPFKDLQEFGVTAEVGIDEEGLLAVSLTMNPDQAVPRKTVSLTQTGRLSEKEMPKTKYRELVKDYTASAVLSVAGDLFALLPVQTVVVEAMMKSAVAEMENHPLVRLDRESFERLDMEHIDPSEILSINLQGADS